MIPTKDILDKKEKDLQAELEGVEKRIDKELINLKELPPYGVEVKLKYRISQETGNRIAKLYNDGGWQVDIRVDNKSEWHTSPHNPEKQEENLIFLATVITLRVKE